MSYSAQGIIEKNLSVPFYNCSWSSLDLYYNFQIYNYMLTQKVFTSVDEVWWVFPYYYFDYDLSLTSNIFPLSTLWRLDDWHHYIEAPGASEYIENFRMFSRKVSEFFSMPKYGYGIANVYSGADNTDLLEPLWFTNHEATVTENKKIFCSFFNKLKESMINVRLIIPPFYLNGFNEVSKAAFETKKEKFYQIINELEKEIGKVPVIDYASIFEARREYFLDATHLNLAGATEFTDILNKNLLKR